MSNFQFETLADAEWVVPEVHPDARRFLVWPSIGPAALRVQQMRFNSPDPEGHAHADADQMFYMISGEGAWVVDGERVPFQAGDTLYVGKNIVHQLAEMESDTVEYFMVHVPVDPAA